MAMNPTLSYFSASGCRVRRWICAFVLFGVVLGAHAQVLDEVTVAPEGDTVTIDVRLLAQVNFQRYLVTPSGNVVQVYFAVTATEENVLGVWEESRTVPGGESLPSFDVRFVSEAQAGTHHATGDWRFV